MLGEPVLQEHDPRVLFVAGDFGRLMAETV
jgi:hypothetical protein